MNSCPGGDYWWEYKNYRYFDTNGTNQRFAAYYDTGGSCHTDSTDTTSGPSIAAKGFVMHLETGWPYVYYRPKDVIGPGGTKVWRRWFYPGEAHYEHQDPNGNYMEQIYTDASGWGNITDTLNRTPALKYDQGNSTVWVYALTSAGYQIYKLYLTASVQMCTSFNVAGVTEFCPGTFGGFLQKIELPDGTTYEFTYEDYPGEYYGLLRTMKLPTGETITFTHSNFTDAQGNKNRWASTVTKGDVQSSQSTYTPATCGINCNKVTVTRPSGDETVYTFSLNKGAWNTQTKAYTGSAASGTLALTVQTDYDTSLTDPVSGGTGFTRPIRRTTNIPGPSGDLVKKTEATFDTYTYSYQGTNYTGSRGNVLTSKEFAFGSGTAGGLLRQQVFSYLHDSNSNYVPKNIVNRVTNVQTKNAVGTKKAETITAYDSTSLTSITGITHHDDTNFGTGYTLRGNPTVIQSWTGSGYLSTTLNYDTTGQVISASDPKGNVTQFSYVDAFYGSCSYSTNTYNAYRTQVTLPVSGTLRYCYYYESGKVYSGTDQNGQATTKLYNDPLDRPTNTNLPYGYDYTQYTNPTQLDYTASGAGEWHSDQITLDWLNRIVYKKLMSDPQGITYIKTTYDTSGRVQSVTNPYRSSPDGSTSYQYDGLNRVKRTTLQDGNYTETFFGSGVGAAGGRTTQLCASGTYGAGFPVLSKDEAGKKRQTWTDALGRLIEADEPDASGALTLGTCYKYDVLGNLLEVDQGVQIRTFASDALSRRTAETTPEAGTLNYYYTTSVGQLCAGNPSALCRATDARGITTTHTYDAENRLTGKTYSNGDPAVSYFYDQTTYNGLTIANGKGRRTGMSDASGQTAWSYNAIGQVLYLRRTIGSVTKTVSYNHNLSNGLLNAMTYPSGMIVSFGYDSTGRTTMICYTSCVPGTDFVHSATYAPQGALASAVLGWVSGGFAGMTSTYTYNNRLQPVNMKTTHTGGTVTVRDYTYSFVSGSINDGQVKSVTNNLATGRSQTYTYEEMNRLATAQSQANSGNDCWGLSFGYDRYANLLSASVTKCSAPMLSLSVDPYTNRITNPGFSYGLSGNLTADGSATYTWNAEGRMASTTGVSYTYDGDNVRVKKSNGKLYWYGLKGEVLAESDLSGNITMEYIYFSGQRIARRDPGSGNVYYFLGDRLGSARVVTNATGGVVEESDFYPYGGERVITDTLDNNYKFTGHERDTESDLDHTEFRKYSANLGRWHSPDRHRGKPSDPQSWNKYSYTAGNPINRVDPNGADWVDVFNDLINSIFAEGYRCLVIPDPFTGEYPEYPSGPSCGVIYWVPWIPLLLPQPEPEPEPPPTPVPVYVKAISDCTQPYELGGTIREISYAAFVAGGSTPLTLGVKIWETLDYLPDTEQKPAATGLEDAESIFVDRLSTSGGGRIHENQFINVQYGQGTTKVGTILGIPILNPFISEGFRSFNILDIRTGSVNVNGSITTAQTGCF